ncbi:phage tail protein [Bordetella avium]|uniref:Phage protein n=1 Tax=Bordetella avium (strain 197N) TaxID=360910 RepID=Q2L292_BORA1|nr:phage protein [Bordetella avium]AZY48861.1 phage tail protein [Bordetella avium]AZY52241.1 phage tail protein [Bordetella avium]RIQ47780.1 phage tail protein [Bordetella avium]RIQ71050.1 phage tail protein [Bordetella avium]CAJ49087.1 putative phage protein [Bordetella avium 197N]
MEIKELPQPPSRSDPESFPERADAFLAALPEFAAQLNALAQRVGADKEVTSRGSASAASSEQAATAQALAAQQANAAAQTSANLAEQSAGYVQRAQSQIQAMLTQSTATLEQLQGVAQEGEQKWQQILDVARNASAAVSPGTYTKLTVDAKGWVIKGESLTDADLPNVTQGKVIGLSKALDSKASSIHTHEIAQVDGLQSALNGKAATHHTHDWSQITGTPNSLGVGQTWQSVGRAANTTYTNTTGKPIMVHVQSSGDGSVTVASITINGQTLTSQSYNGRTASISAIVPNGMAYQVGGRPSMTVRELR